MLADIGNPTPAELARALDVSPVSVRRWVRADQAPRPVLLALFWLTRWGQSVVACDATNQAQQLAGLLRCLREQLDQAHAEVAELHRTSIDAAGAANGPRWSTVAAITAGVMPLQPGERERGQQRRGGAHEHLAREGLCVHSPGSFSTAWR